MIAAALLALALQAGVPEASDVFRQRQDDLILLSRKLGTLHRLDQVCPGGREAGVFRDRMQDVVEGERPIRATREAMIDAFNLAYNETALVHAACGGEAMGTLRREVTEALRLIERLSAGMGQPQTP